MLAVGAGTSARSARKITTIRHAFALRMLSLHLPRRQYDAAQLDDFFFCKLPLSVRNLDCRALRRIRVGAGEELIHQQDHRFRGGQGDGGLGPFGCRCTTRTLLAEVHVCADLSTEQLLVGRSRSATALGGISGATRRGKEARKNWVGALDVCNVQLCVDSKTGDRNFWTLFQCSNALAAGLAV